MHALASSTLRHAWVFVFIAGALVMVGPTSVFAAPPAITGLYPTGGRVGETVKVSLVGTPGPGKLTCVATGLASDVGLITGEPGAKEGEFVLKISDKATPGLYFLQFVNDDGAAAPRPFAVGALPELTEVEPNNEHVKPHALKESCVVNGRLNPAGDVDGFAIKLAAGQTVVAHVEADRPFGSPMDAILQIVDSLGFVQAQNHDNHGLDPRLVFTATKADTFVVRLFAYSSTPSTTFSFGGGDTFIYRLTVSTAPFIDRALPLAVSRTGETRLKLAGWNLTESLASVTFKEPVAPFEKAARVRLGDGTHGLLLPVCGEGVELEREPNAFDQPQKVSLPVCLTGEISHPADTDTFLVEAKKGQRLTIRVEANALGFPTDPFVAVHDAAGMVVRTLDDSPMSRDLELVLPITVDGAYRVSVRDLNGDGSARHLYRLRLAVDNADVELSVAQREFAFTPDKPLDIPVKLNRQGKFTDELAVSIEGLPEGYECPPQPALATGATAKEVKLTVKAGSAPFSGPVRIVARSKTDDSVVRWATTPDVPGFPAPWTTQWLHYPPAKAPAAAKPPGEKKGEEK